MQSDKGKPQSGFTLLSANQSHGTLCVKFPPMINSDGIWNHKNPMQYSLPTLELQILLSLALSHLLYFPLKRLGIPRLLSQIMAGMILGSSFLGYSEKFQSTVFPYQSQVIIDPLTYFGYIIFLFLSGVKIDVGMIKESGGRAWVIGILNLVTPLMIDLSLSLVYTLERTDDNFMRNFSAILTSQSMSSFPVVVCFLKDLKILNSELGRLALSATLISNLLDILNRIFGIYIYTDMKRASEDIVICVVFILFIIFVIRPGFVWLAKQTPEGRPVKDLHVYLVLLVLLVSGILSHIFDLTAIFGPFVVGLAVPDGPPLGSAVVDKLESFNSTLLLPAFVCLCSMKVNLWRMDFPSKITRFTVLIIFTTFVAKSLFAFLPAIYCKMPLKDSLALSLIMSTRGIVDIANISFLRDLRILNTETYSLLVVATAFSATICQIFVKLLYDPRRKYAGYRKRNIMHSENNGKLPILVCVHKPNNTAAIIKLLKAYSPTPESPINVYVLHLIELCGRASPIFISHQIHKQTVTDFTYSEDVILSFSKYQSMNYGAVTVQAFTAISPRTLMHEDICTLALDTLASIIILPFHRQWAIDGTVDSEDLTLRSLNQSVIDVAPCSIGILVDRGLSNSKGSSTTGPYTVCMIYLGGYDDQEALIYAKRMAKDANVSLTVVHLISASGEDDSLSEKERIFDAAVLNDVKYNKTIDGAANFRYIAQVVNGGNETSVVLRALVNEFDLIIVGRRKNVESAQISGLEEWNEFPELGAIGDLLASSDLKGKASVLVVQQQQTTTE